MRLDIERKLQLDAGQMDAISDWLQEADKVEAIVLSDYAKGVLTRKMIRRVISIAQYAGYLSSSTPKVGMWRAMRAPRCSPRTRRIPR
jgi:bifunctional ADP-heptose synthase (sugar kinase/adenylyltransferase)